jgi:S-adenosylmethionine:tRNA ribosyltransferase-isomerase
MFARHEYSFTLPQELIAEEAVHPAHDAKMMVLDRDSGEILSHSHFWNLDTFLGDDRVIFFNNSKVIRARIPLQNIAFQKENGTTGIIKDGEIFFLAKKGERTFEALVRPGKSLRIGAVISLGKYTFTIRENTLVGRLIEISGGSIEACMEEYGELPLPPYIEYQKEKEKDYQTIFAEKSGSVAAPTASLHFTDALLEKIQIPQYSVTLHVGLGTFKPIDTEDIRDYRIHKERAEIPLSLFGEIAKLKSENKKIVAVGTTVCRTLESLPALWQQLNEREKHLFKKPVQEFWHSLAEQRKESNYISEVTRENNAIFFATEIYITPGHTFLLVDDLITNFHLPESSLLVLVSAFLPKEGVENAYQTAIKHQYRFYSFGDGMYIRGK